MIFKNRPALITSVLYAVGICAGRFLNISFYFTLMIASLLFFVLLIIIILKNNDNIIIKNILLIFLIIFIGILKITIDGKSFAPNHVSRFLYIPEKVIVTGIIGEEPFWRNKRLVFPLNVQKILFDNDTVDVEGNIICSVMPDTTYDKVLKKLKYGDKIFAVGRLAEPATAKNPGDFDYKKYREINNIYGHFYITGFYSLFRQSEGNGNFVFSNIINPIRKSIISKIDSTMGSIEGAFLKGLLVGDRTDIPEDIKESFSNAGVIHILAVSGLNVVFVIIIFMSIASVFPFNEKFKTIFVIFSLILYMYITGATPSIVRATIMGIVILFGRLLERKSDPLNSLGVAGLIILAIDSKQLFDIGFQLSFLCVFSLIYFFPYFDTLSFWKYKIFNYRLFRNIIRSIIGSIIVSLFLLPVLALTAEKISIISIFANLIVIPIANISLALGFAQILSGLFSDYLFSVLTEANQFILWGCLKTIQWFGSFSFSAIEVYSFNTLKAIIYYFLLFTTFYFLKKSSKVSLIFLLLMSLNYYIWVSFLSDNNEPVMEVSFLDIGQGDATLFELPSKKTVLIDTGPKNENFNAGEKILSPYLKRKGINKINYLILTHRHDDHIGGASYLINHFDVGQVFVTTHEVKSFLNDELMNSIAKNHVKCSTTNAGKVIEIDNLKIYFINPAKQEQSEHYVSKNSSENNASIVVIVKYGKIQILMSGDIEKETESFLVKYYPELLHSDILKVGHHGSKNSASQNFLGSVKPKYSIISLSSLNNFHFPSTVTINRLKSINTEILRTNQNGAIIFKTDGDKLERVIWR